MPEALRKYAPPGAADVAVGDVHAAEEAHAAVDDGDLAVVAVVDLVQKITVLVSNMKEVFYQGGELRLRSCEAVVLEII